MCENISELRQLCSPFEDDSLNCLCSNSYTSVTSVVQSSPSKDLEMICAQDIKSRLFLALDLPLNASIKTEIYNGNGYFSFWNVIRYSSIFKHESISSIIKNVFFVPPLKLPLNLANFLSFPSYQKLLTIIESIQFDSTGTLAKWRTSERPAFIVTITPENVMQIVCQSAQLASQLGDIGVRIQCKINRLLQAAFVCAAENEINLIKNVTTKKDLLESLDIEIATSKICKYKKNGDFVIYDETNNENVFFSLEDLHVSKMNPLPDVIPNEVIEKERLAYLILFTAARRSSTFLLTFSPRNDAISEPICDFIPGWRTELVVFVREEGLNVSVSDTSQIKDNRVPELFVSRFIQNSTNSTDKTCDVLIVSRPTVTRQEWYNNFVSTLIPFLPMNNLKYMAHSGFVKVAKAVDEQLTSYIDHLLHKKCSSVNAYITGHSLGAATGQILALFLRERIQSEKLKINGVFFAPPNVFNKEAAEYYATVINSRIIVHPRDPVTLMPCTVEFLPKGYPSCPSFDKNQQKFDHNFRNVFYLTPGRYSIPYTTEREIIATFEMTSQLWNFNTNFMKKFHIDTYYDWVSSICIP